MFIILKHIYHSIHNFEACRRGAMLCFEVGSKRWNRHRLCSQDPLDSVGGLSTGLPQEPQEPEVRNAPSCAFFASKGQSYAGWLWSLWVNSKPPVLIHSNGHQKRIKSNHCIAEFIPFKTSRREQGNFKVIMRLGTLMNSTFHQSSLRSSWFLLSKATVEAAQEAAGVSKCCESSVIAATPVLSVNCSLWESAEPYGGHTKCWRWAAESDHLTPWEWTRHKELPNPLVHQCWQWSHNHQFVGDDRIIKHQSIRNYNAPILFCCQSQFTIIDIFLTIFNSRIIEHIVLKCIKYIFFKYINLIKTYYKYINRHI